MSGAEPDDAGTRTDSRCTRAVAGADDAMTTPASAPSAVTHGIVEAQVPDAGPEQGDSSDEAPSETGMTAAVVGRASAAASITMPAMDRPAGAASAVTVPDIGPMPGMTHTAPPATMLRWPAKRASSRPAERRMRVSISE